MSQELKFPVTVAENTFLDPRTGFSPRREAVQVRADPLTGRRVRVAHFGLVKPQPLEWDAYRDSRVKGYCPFCPEHRDSVTPRFLPHLVPEGRLARGEALVVPDLYPYDAVSALAILTNAHVVLLQELTVGIVRDGLLAGFDLLRRVSRNPGAPRYTLSGWNYMPPSGGDLVHPHMQFFATDEPGNRYLDELQASLRFLLDTGSDYASALLREERERDERYLGRVGEWHWLASFAPLGLLGSLECLLPGVYCLSELQETHLESLAEGLACAFRFFSAERIHSFNAALFVGPEEQRAFAVRLRLVPRTFLNTRDHAPDQNFFPTVLDEPVSVVLPEDLASRAKPWFTGKGASR